MILKSKIKEIENFYNCYNQCSELYNKLEEMEVKLGEKLIKKVHSMYYSSSSQVKNDLGYLKDHYKYRITFSNFNSTIFKTIGKGDLESGKVKFLQEVNKLAISYLEKLKNRYDVSKNDIVFALLIVILLNIYKGFLYEDLQKDILKLLFKVEESKTLDDKYKIDLLVSLNKAGVENYKVGLQLKSYTFFRKWTSSNAKINCKNGHSKAIRDKICNIVYFLLHNKLDTVKIDDDWENCLIKSNRLTNSSTNYKTTIVDDLEEELIDELLYSILVLYNEYNPKKMSLKELKKDLENEKMLT